MIFDPEIESWTPADSLSVPRENHSATLLNDGRILVVGGYSSGIGYQSSCEIYEPSIIDNVLDNKTTKSFRLLQNYPNPFNPSTTIHYYLSKAANVDLRIFNIMGREVERLVNEQQTEGDYEIKWQPVNLSSGAYLYQLRIGDFAKTRKLIFVK